jgi:nicotinamide mononucleotide transporter
MTALEITANAITTVSIFLAGRGSIHTWWTGIVGAALFAVLFYSNQLFADVTLQIFFIGTSILGWMRWQNSNAAPLLLVTRINAAHLATYAGSGLVVASIYGAILHRYSNAYAPFWDSVILVASVIAQLLLVRKKLETWLFWLVVNTIAVPLYMSRGLHLTGGLYAAYWLNALISWFLWRRETLRAAQ